MKKNGGDQMDTLKILVVDDESRMRKLVKDFLTKKKQAVFLHDGKELASVVREEREVSKKEVLKVKLRAGGGFVGRCY